MKPFAGQRPVLWILWFAWALPAVTLCSCAAAQEEALRFAQPMTAVIHAGRWDQTQAEWAQGEDADACFFDAAYRFLLVRFPGSAEAVHARLAEGYVLQSAEVKIRGDRSPWPRSPGIESRSFALPEGAPEPRWNVGLWALRRPWIDDAVIGPTWNAWIQGAGWWRAGGAHGLEDRVPARISAAEVSNENPIGRFDVTAVLADSAFGADVAERLINAESRGFLVRRTDLSHPEFGDGAMDTGAVPLYVFPPVLEVTLRRAGPAAAVDPLPPVVDVAALAAALREAGGDGTPTTRAPDNLAALVDAWRARRRGDMPAWMWKRVQEVWTLPHHFYGNPANRDNEVFTRLVRALDSADPERYAEQVMSWQLNVAPARYRGHSHIHDVLPLLAFPELLPEVVRHGRAVSIEARWPQFPSRTNHLFRVVTQIGTLNHMAQSRPTALLSAEAVGIPWLARDAVYGLIALNRKNVSTVGFSQEMGDSYYRGITLSPLQSAARFSRDPLLRLKCELMVEKLLFEDITTYHPGLRHRVSRMARRLGGAYQLMLGQEVPEAALHMLSRRGVLIETDRLAEGPRVHDVRILDMDNAPPVRVALSAPWGGEWETHAIDDKPLPFRSVFSSYLNGGIDEPIHAMTYMGRHYALASEDAYTSGGVPVFAAWRRVARTVERVEDFSVMILQGRLNEVEPSTLDKTRFGTLQHDRTLIWATVPIERKFFVDGHRNLPASAREGVTRFKAQASLVSYGEAASRMVFINGVPVHDFPATAGPEARITIQDGVSYIGLIPLPATDLGRADAIVLRHEPPFLNIAAYVMDREAPLRADDDDGWAAFAEALSGWVVELGDETEHAGFEAFQEHVHAAQLEIRRDDAARVWHIDYTRGEDRMEMGFRTTFERRDLWHFQCNPSEVFAYRRVNGRSPGLPLDLAIDSPLGQLGTAARLEKGGAVLESGEGQMALLKVEPLSATTTAINPFLDPTPFRLTTPEGIEVWSEGPFTLGRIVVRPRENELRVDYHLPRAVHLDALQRGRDHFVLTPGGQWMSPTHLGAIGRLEAIRAQPEPKFFPMRHLPAADIPRMAARTLAVRGFDSPPTVVLNGRRQSGPTAAFTQDGCVWHRVVIAE